MTPARAGTTRYGIEEEALDRDDPRSRGDDDKATPADLAVFG